jgi:hypothetical protein
MITLSVTSPNWAKYSFRPSFVVSWLIPPTKIFLNVYYERKNTMLHVVENNKRTGFYITFAYFKVVRNLLILCCHGYVLFTLLLKVTLLRMK